MSAYRRSRDNVFGAVSLDRLSERREDVDWIAAEAAAEHARFLVMRPDGHALVRADASALRMLTSRERAAMLPDLPSSFLGAQDGVTYFALATDAETSAGLASALDGAYLDLRSAATRLPALESGVFAYARALAHWQSRMRFCPVCGSTLRAEAAGHRMRCTNSACGVEQFPRTDPAIIVIVSWRDACLLGRQPGWPARRYSTLAGFVEPGETLEDAVRREVFEESGVRVVDCDYHSSQPWPFPSSLMLGFTARADDPAIAVGAELEEARWFEVDDMVKGLKSRELVLPPPVSVSFRLIEHWLRETAGLELAGLLTDEPWLAPKPATT